LRDVAAAAGQRNHSAAQYHFGDREGLVAAVYETRMHVVDARRHAYLETIAAEGRGDEITALVEAIVVPLVEVVAETDSWYGRFLGRTRWEQGAWQVLQEVPSSTSFATAMRKLGRQLRDLPRPIRHHRLDQFMTLVVGTIAGWEGAPARGQKRLSSRALAEELVTTSVAVLTADTRIGAST
jgi:AcrR family transcriptional regulator